MTSTMTLNFPDGGPAGGAPPSGRSHTGGAGTSDAPPGMYYKNAYRQIDVTNITTFVHKFRCIDIGFVKNVLDRNCPSRMELEQARMTYGLRATIQTLAYTTSDCYCL